MAEFYTTTGVLHQLEELIKQSKEKLILISPYLRPSLRIKDLLADKNQMKIDIRVVYGRRDKLRDEVKSWLESMTYIRGSSYANLHSKCYINEQAALVTSMNLYSPQKEQSHEIGLLVDKEEEPDLYSKIADEAMLLVRLGEEMEVKVAREPGSASEGSSSEAVPKCPKCDGEMVKRTVKKGENKGRTFWGCSAFPKCRGQRLTSSVHKS